MNINFYKKHYDEYGLKPKSLGIDPEYAYESWMEYPATPSKTKKLTTSLITSAKYAVVSIDNTCYFENHYFDPRLIAFEAYYDKPTLPWKLNEEYGFHYKNDKDLNDLLEFIMHHDYFYILGGFPALIFGDHDKKITISDINDIVDRLIKIPELDLKKRKFSPIVYCGNGQDFMYMETFSTHKRPS